MLKKIFELIKETLFPVFCLGCNTEGSWLCEKCLRAQNDLVGNFCPVCRKNSRETCSECAGQTNLAGAFSFTSYSENSVIGKLLREFKYNFAESAAQTLEKIVIQFNQNKYFDANTLPNDRVIIPVPLHHRRERERGFNQSAILARIIEKNIFLNKIPIDEKSFSRVRHTDQQAKLNKNERLKNVREAFVWRGAAACPPNIILVDDVFTTGATLESCAEALRGAGAKKVFAITFGRAERAKNDA